MGIEKIEVHYNSTQSILLHENDTFCRHSCKTPKTTLFAFSLFLEMYLQKVIHQVERQYFS